ncbi:hypothetical protein AJ87_08045 [Rhizobium yanglingense]|nr:hypothetical protein AJ87_08045 [Rhizobium yanglingense]
MAETRSTRRPGQSELDRHGKFLSPSLPAFHDDWSETEAPSYTRNSGHNQICLKRKLAAMEGGEDAAVFATGIAALHAVFFTFLKSGDHVIVGDVTYEAVWRVFAELLPQRYQIQTTFIDMGDMDVVNQRVDSFRIRHWQT